MVPMNAQDLLSLSGGPAIRGLSVGDSGSWMVRLSVVHTLGRELVVPFSLGCPLNSSVVETSEKRRQGLSHPLLLCRVRINSNLESEVKQGFKLRPYDMGDNIPSFLLTTAPIPPSHGGKIFAFHGFSCPDQEESSTSKHF